MALLGGVILITVFELTRDAWAVLPRFEEVLFERGLIARITAWIALIALADLLWKIVLVTLENRAVRSPRLMETGLLDGDALQQLAGQVVQESRSPIKRGSRWLNRIHLALSQVARKESKGSIRQALATREEADEGVMHSNYLFVKVLIWALPLLGFIGTVVGIGQAISNFSAVLEKQSKPESALVEAGNLSPFGAESPEEDSSEGDPMARIKSALRDVTSGLGTAFDTTFLALIVTVPLMLFMTLVEKLDWDQLRSVGTRIERGFVLRLPADRGGGLPSGDELERLTSAASEFREGASRALETARHLRPLADLAEGLDQGGLPLRVSLDSSSTRKTS